MSETKPVRVQLSRRKGWKMPPNTVRVDRAGVWGNPFIVGKHGTRAECVDLYLKLAMGYVCISLPNVEDQRVTCGWMKKAGMLKGMNLACWCPLPKEGEPDVCHAAVLLTLANR